MFEENNRRIVFILLLFDDSKALNRIVAVHECDATMLNRNFHAGYKKKKLEMEIRNEKVNAVSPKHFLIPNSLFLI
jgi:hypothetical protein